MKYMGSKARHAKDIISVINEYRTSEKQWYIEPFCGGCNLIEHVKGNRIASDKHNYLISMWKELQNNWMPNDYYSEEEYYNAKSDFDKRTNDFYQDYEIAFIGFASSYGGRFFEGYARGNDAKGNARNYTLESKKNIIKQIPNLKGVHFKSMDYKDIPDTKDCLYYCDSPYKGTKAYKTSLLGKFDHDEYYDWLRKRGENNIVLVSEYEMPHDFECIWEKLVNNSLTQDTGAKQGTEKLFIYKKF